MRVKILNNQKEEGGDLPKAEAGRKESDLTTKILKRELIVTRLKASKVRKKKRERAC